MKGACLSLRRKVYHPLRKRSCPPFSIFRFMIKWEIQSIRERAFSSVRMAAPSSIGVCLKGRSRRCENNEWDIVSGEKVLTEDKEANLIRFGRRCLEWVNLFPSVLHFSGWRENHCPRENPVLWHWSQGFKNTRFREIIQITARISSAPSISQSSIWKESHRVVTFKRLEGRFSISSFHEDRKLTPSKGKTLSEWEADRERLQKVFMRKASFPLEEDYKKAFLFRGSGSEKPSYAGAYFQSVLQCQLGQYVAAFEAYRRAIQIKPDSYLHTFFWVWCIWTLGMRITP